MGDARRADLPALSERVHRQHHLAVSGFLPLGSDPRIGADTFSDQLLSHHAPMAMAAARVAQEHRGGSTGSASLEPKGALRPVSKPEVDLLMHFTAVSIGPIPPLPHHYTSVSRYVLDSQRHRQHPEYHDSRIQARCAYMHPLKNRGRSSTSSCALSFRDRRQSLCRISSLERPLPARRLFLKVQILSPSHCNVVECTDPAQVVRTQLSVRCKRRVLCAPSALATSYSYYHPPRSGTVESRLRQLVMSAFTADASEPDC